LKFEGVLYVLAKQNLGLILGLTLGLGIPAILGVVVGIVIYCKKRPGGNPMSNSATAF
jgi:hypothetical protein